MSRRRKQPVVKVRGGRGVKPSPPAGRRRGSPEERLNRILLIGGGLLALGAVVISLQARPFNPGMLGINLAAIGLGLLMGKGIGRFMFRRVLPTSK